MSKQLQAALTAVRKLPRAERRIVFHSLMAKDGPEASAVQRRSEDWLLPGLEWELRRRGLLSQPLIERLVQRQAPDYDTHAISVRTWLKKAIQKPLNQAQLLALGRVAARALADYVQAEKLPLGVSLGPRSLLMNVSDLPVAINKAFPGYAACGMLGAIIRV